MLQSARFYLVFLIGKKNAIDFTIGFPAKIRNCGTVRLRRRGKNKGYSIITSNDSRRAMINRINKEFTDLLFQSNKES